MKYKFIFHIIILLATQICIGQNSISISNSSGANNTEIEISVLIDNVQTFTGFQFDITLPTNISYIANSIVISNRAVNQTISASVINDTTLRILAYSPTNANFNGTSGEIFKFRLKPNTLIATYPLNVTNEIISNISNGNIISNIVNGSLQVLANNESNVISVGNAVGYNYSEIEIPVLINNTQTLNAFQFDIKLPNNINYVENSIAQTTRFTNHVLTTSIINGNILRLVAYSPTNANLTGNSGEVFRFRIRSTSLAGSYPLNINNGIVSNVTFGNVLTNVVNGTLLLLQSNEKNILTLGNTSGNNNTEIEMPISIDNSQTFNAFQFDITLPNNISYVANSIVISNRAVDHTITANLINGNTLRFIGLSTTNANFNGTSGEIFKFRLKSSVTQGIYPLLSNNAKLVNSNLGNIITNQSDGQIEILAQNVISSNYLMVQNQLGYKNLNNIFSIVLKNNDMVKAVQFDVELPSGFNLIPSNITTTSRSASFTVSASLLSGNKYRVLLYSLSNLSLSIGDGTILNFPVTLSSTLNTGIYSFIYSNVVISNTSNQNVSSTALEDGKITVTNAPIVLNAKVLLQGPYVTNTVLMSDVLRNRGLIPTTSPYADATTTASTVFNLGGTTTTGLVQNDIVDWVWVELRDKNNNSVIIASKSALLQRDGDVVSIDGNSALSFSSTADNYYIMIRHRNHLGILSTNTVSLSNIASSVDFTTNSLLVSGGTNGIAAIGNGKFALFAGDFNGDGQVQNTDKNVVEPLRGISGYSNADIDMNGEVQNAEINSVLNPNIGKGKQF